MADEPCAKSIDWLYNWCAGLIPSVYDESLTYYEQLAKILTVLKETIAHLAETDAENKKLQELYNILKEQFDAFVDGRYDDYYEELLKIWLDENGADFLKKNLLTGVFFGLTSDGYFCAYKPSTWEDVQFDTGAIYGTEEYGRLILRCEVNGQGVINNTGYDASVMSDTIDSRLKAAAGNGLEYDDKSATLNVKKADDITFGGVKLKHEVDNDDTDEWAVTSDGVYAYTPGYRTPPLDTRSTIELLVEGKIASCCVSGGIMFIMCYDLESLTKGVPYIKVRGYHSGIRPYYGGVYGSISIASNINNTTEGFNVETQKNVATPGAVALTIPVYKI